MNHVRITITSLPIRHITVDAVSFIKYNPTLPFAIPYIVCSCYNWKNNPKLYTYPFRQNTCLHFPFLFVFTVDEKHCCNYVTMVIIVVYFPIFFYCNLWTFYCNNVNDSICSLSLS